MQILHYQTGMDITLFRDLERLSHTGNFSRAAAQGHLSQPAFSRRIKALEEWVGATLVDRSHQPVSLTGAGVQILEAGLQACARIEQERSQILEAQSLPDKYVVTFGAQHSIGWRFFPEWFQALEDAYGPILSRLRADDLPICMRELKSGDVDFVIAYHDANSELGHENLSVLIGTDQLVPVCKPDQTGQPIFQFDSADVEMPYLRFGDAAPISKHLAPLFHRQNLDARLRVVYENSMAGALRIRARAGDGVAWLPRNVVAQDLDAGLLVCTGDADWQIDLEIRLIANPENSNRTTRAILAFLEDRQNTPFL